VQQGVPPLRPKKWAGLEEEVGQEQSIDLAELTSKQVSPSGAVEDAQGDRRSP